MAKSCPKEYGYLKNGKCVKHKIAKKPKKPSLLKSAKSTVQGRLTSGGGKSQKRAEVVGRGLMGALTWGGTEALLTAKKFVKGRKKKAEVQKSLAAGKAKRDRIKVQKSKPKSKGGKRYAAK